VHDNRHLAELQVMNDSSSSKLISYINRDGVLEDCPRPRGQNLAALASNLALASNQHGLGLDAVLMRLGVFVSVAGIYANVIWTIGKIHLVPIVLVPSRLVLASAEMSTYWPIATLTA
jgi:hypothetical protein